MIPIKNNKKITPLIFTLEEYEHLSYLKLSRRYGPYHVNLMHSFAFDYVGEISEYNAYYIRQSNSSKYYSHFHGGFFMSSYGIVAMIVKFKDELYLLLCKEFVEEEKAIADRIKRNVKLIDIDPKKKLILATKEEIQSTYSTLLNPTLNDYNPEIQKSISREFLEFKRQSIIQKEVELTEI